MKLKYYLIACEENQYRPWITSTTALALFCAIAWGLKLLILPTAFTNAAAGIDAFDLMQKVNQERINRYLTPLRTDERLTAAATAKSNDMLARSYFAHVDPDGKYVWYRIEAAGYKPYLTLGENLAMDFTTSGGVVAGWMNSPAHRANILNEKFEDQGMAAIYGMFEPNHNSTLVTNLFGAMPKKISSQPAAPATPTAPVAKPSPAPASPAPKPTPTPAPQPSPIVAASPSGTAPASPQQTQTQTQTQPDKSLPASPEEVAKLPMTIPQDQKIPVSGETQLYYALRVIFAIFALAYVFFLILDSVIIHRAKIARKNIPSSPHTLLFLLFALVSIFTLYL